MCDGGGGGENGPFSFPGMVCLVGAESEVGVVLKGISSGAGEEAANIRYVLSAAQLGPVAARVK